MASYKVTSVEQAAAGQSDRGPWTRQKLVIENDTGTPQTVTLFCNQYQPVPQVGQTLDGEVLPAKQDGWTPEFKPARKAGGFGGGGRDTPETRRSIAMQHAQKCAVDALRLAADHGDYKPPSAGDVATQVKAIAAVLWQQVMDAEKEAS